MVKFFQYTAPKGCDIWLFIFKFSLISDCLLLLVSCCFDIPIMHSLESALLELLFPEVLTSTFILVGLWLNDIQRLRLVHTYDASISIHVSTRKNV